MNEVTIERLSEYSENDAVELGKLMRYLSKKFDGEPVDENLLKDIIESPYHDQLVARIEGRIVGAATMSILMGAGAGEKAYLNDFVTDPEFQQKGIGGKIWNEMMLWCQDFGVDLEFTSSPEKEAAQKFYKDHNAVIRNTNVFHVDIKK